MELFEFQNGTIKSFEKAVKSVRERFTVTKALDKHMESILSNLVTYEVMFDTLYRVREISSTVMESKELETIEGEMKVLNDTFWN